jgi:uncharacterized protein DUF6498
MKTALRLFVVLVLNGITVYGVFAAGWSVATAVALYWCENVIGIILITLLFVLHRRATHKVGHERSVLRNFLLVTIPFTFGHGLFLAALIAVVFPRVAPSETFNFATFQVGLALVGGAMLLRFLIEVVRVKTVPFLEIRRIADSFAPRVFVVHVTIIGGMFAMAAFGHVRAFFAVFAALKFIGDLIGIKAGEEMPDPSSPIADDEMVAEA